VRGVPYRPPATPAKDHAPMPRPIAPLVALLAALPVLVACASPPPPPAPLEADSTRPLSVGFLIVNGVYDTELTAPLDVFHHTVFHTTPGMRVFTVAPTLEPVTTFEGLRLIPDHAFVNAPPIDVLVVPSAEHNMDSDLANEALIHWVRTTGRRARYVMSLCDGAFVLAAAGLLDDRQATTFPADIEPFRAMFSSKVACLDGPSFVHDGPAITSVGGVRSFEPALYLCELLYGAKVARGVAKGLVIDWDRTKVAHVVRQAPTTESRPGS